MWWPLVDSEGGWVDIKDGGTQPTWCERGAKALLCDSGEVCPPLWASVSSSSIKGNNPFFLTQWVVQMY